MTGATMEAMRERVLTRAQLEALRVLGSRAEAEQGRASDLEAGTVNAKAAGSLRAAGLADHRLTFARLDGGLLVRDWWSITDAGRAVLDRVEEALRHVRGDAA